MYKTWQIQLDTILENTNYQQCSLTKNTYVQRFEFIEILVRVAEFKYIKNGTETRYGVALRNLMFDMEPQIQDELQHVWGRNAWRQTLISEPVNAVLNRNMRLLEELHSKYTKRPDRPAHAKPGEFVIEDAYKMFDDAQIKHMNAKICTCFPVSKQCLIVNDSEEAGQHTA